MAICEAYKERPDECELSWKIKTYQHGLMESIDNQNFTDPEDRDESLQAALQYMNVTEHAQVSFAHKKGNWGHIFLMILAIIAVNGCVLIWYRRKVKRENNEEIESQVNSAVNKYFELASTEK